MLTRIKWIFVTSNSIEQNLREIFGDNSREIVLSVKILLNAHTQ